MEALNTLASNGLWSLGTVLVIIGVLVVLIKKGTISFQGKGLKIGENIPRELIRNQWEFAASSCESQFSKIREYCSSDTEAKYLISKVNDIFQAAIVYNFMSESEDYVRAKQALVLNAILKRSTNEHFRSADFKACCDAFVQDLIKNLVRMKRLYR